MTAAQGARGRPLRGVGRDARLAVRAVALRPGFGATVMVVTAVTVAVAGLVLSVVDGTLLRPPTHGDAQRSVIVWGRNALNGQLRDVVSGSNYIDLRRGAPAFEHMAAIKPDDVVLIEEGRPYVMPTLTVTWEFFEVLGVEAARGRTFHRADGVSGSEPVAVLTARGWRDRLAGVAEPVGRRLRTANGFVTVIGVLPDDFEFAARVELFVPLHDDVLATHDRTSYNYWIVGRLRQGVTMSRAANQLEAVMERIRAEDPRLTGWSVAIPAPTWPSSCGCKAARKRYSTRFVRPSGRSTRFVQTPELPGNTRGDIFSLGVMLHEMATGTGGKRVASASAFPPARPLTPPTAGG